MYKVLLVEDIDLIRKDIREMTDWKSHGYQIVGEARNGEQGITMYKVYAPDIVITDIKMPVMNGMEMIDRILEINPNAQFILLTAYGEFDYAKKAISLGISSYLLKHELEETGLLNELDKLRKKIELSRKMNLLSRTETLRKRLEEKMPYPDLIREDFISWKGSTNLSVIQPAFSPSDEKYRDFKPFLQAVKDNFKPEILRCFNVTNHLYLFFANVSFIKTSSEMDRYLLRIAHFIQDTYSRIYEENCAIAIGPSFSDFSQICSAYDETKTIIRHKVFFDGNCILSRGMFLNKPTGIPPVIASNREAFGKHLREQNFALARKDLKICFGELLPKYPDIALYQELTSYVIKQMAGLKEPELPADMVQNLLEIKAAAPELPVTLLAEKLCDSLRLIEQTLVPQYSRKVEEVLQYIRLHYSENISLQDLSEKLGVSSLYVSQLFKKEVGINLMSYITSYRINIAVQLLKSGKYKIYEVSEMVGYQTVQYFSSCFRKETGKKPSDYI